ncbi:MAG: PilN domain-containing protein [Candidatus Omnitrophota bacterium]
MKRKVTIEFSEGWLKTVVTWPSAIKKHGENTKIIVEPLEGLDFINIKNAISTVFNELKQSKNLEVTVVLSRNKITLRRLDLPSRNQEEIQSMLGLHVVRQVPYPKEEIIWSHQNLGFDGISNSQILLAIAHREILRNIFNSFMTRNILPDAMLISSQGAINHLYQTVKDKSLFHSDFLLLDIDHNFSDFMLVHNQNLRSSVVISQGSGQLKQEQDRKNFISGLKQALVVFNGELPNIQLNHVFVTGATEEAGFLQGIFEKDLNLKPQIIKYPELKHINAKDYKSISLSGVLGFSAYRKKEDLCLALPEAQIKREMQQKVKQLLIFGVCVIYIFVLAGAGALIRINQFEARTATLISRIAELKESAGEVLDTAQKIRITRKYFNASQSVAAYIYELTSLVPDTVTLTNFNWQWQKDFSIRGFAPQMVDVSDFVKILNSSDFFSSVQTRYMRRRTQQGKELVNFELSLK